MKKELSNIEYQEIIKKEEIHSIILLLVYFSLLGLDSFTANVELKSIKYIFAIVFYVGLFLLSILLFKDRLKNDFIVYKENAKKDIRFIIPRLVVMYIIYFAVSFFLLIIRRSISANQSTINNLPILIYYILVFIWAPIIEEIIFRVAIRRIIKNDKLFIIASAVIFGLIHCLSEKNIYNIIITAIPFSILGGFYAYVYSKTNNVVNNILCHFFHNGVLPTILKML